MNGEIGHYTVVELPVARQIVLSFLNLSVAHGMYAMLEVDVTRARQTIEAHKERTGERLSFTGYLAYCLAKAVNEDITVQAYLKGRKKLVLFDDVDVGMMIERELGGTRAPTGYVIRRANHKSYLAIHQEIRSVQSGPPPQQQSIPPWLRLMLWLPGPLPKLAQLFVRLAKRRDPARRWVAMAGTVGLTAVGMFGKRGGWGLAPVEHTLCLIVGGIAHKPAVVEDRIELREFLSLTVAFDHDVVDGAPASRFVQRLVELIETGHGLDTLLQGTEDPTGA